MNKESNNPKYIKLKETGQRLFWKYGFRRVSVDEICREAEVSKMTFYRFFENKTDLAKQIFSEVVRKSVEKFNEIIDSDIAPSEKLKLIITMKLEGTNDISREFLTDFYNTPDSELQKFVKETTMVSWDMVISGFRRGQKNGWLRKDFKPEFLLYLSENIKTMLNNEKLLKLYNTPQDMIMEIANFFTYGISAHR